MSATTRSILSSRLPARRLVARLAPLAPWAAALLVSGAALAGNVRGQVSGHDRLINPVWAESAKSGAHRFTWREPSPTVRVEFRQLFGFASQELCIAAIAKSELKQPPPTIPIKIGGGRTTPVTIVVAPGTHLRFRNNDPFAHSLYTFNDKSLPASVMAVASEREWTAPGPGTYEIRDQLAPSVRSWVVVKPGVAGIGYPGRDGMFALEKLPAGDYTLQPYFAGKPIGTPRDVTVGNGDLDISRQPIPVAEPTKAEPPKSKAESPKTKDGKTNK